MKSFTQYIAEVKTKPRKPLTVALPVDIDGKKYSAVLDKVFVHSNVTTGNRNWNTSTRKMRRPLKPGPHHDNILAKLEKYRQDSDT